MATTPGTPAPALREFPARVAARRRSASARSRATARRGQTTPRPARAPRRLLPPRSRSDAAPAAQPRRDPLTSNTDRDDQFIFSIQFSRLAKFLATGASPVGSGGDAV